MQPSSLIASVNYIVLHQINEKKRATKSFASLAELLVPSLEFLAATMAGILVYLICLGLFSLCLAKLPGGSRESHLPIKILAFFFMLFWFFIDQLYNGNLSTESITVDVSDLLYSEEQLRRTDKEPCFLDR